MRHCTVGKYIVSEREESMDGRHRGTTHFIVSLLLEGGSQDISQSLLLPSIHVFYEFPLTRNRHEGPNQ